ncbi:sugar kinase [Achromobacter sp. AONIH1]|jgi:sugar/nucleoside kinase (ribokinase family)|uniref:sugar kinase n=1 Tax=Achromobacter sp. AONIH1 TaxID=1758194 RepID=UPI000CD2D4A7|nr:sugar kinase [Achromobacter sp. AONIH1]AUT46149.1 ribokinase [Achromobacter sp. AONIH1]
MSCTSLFIGHTYIDVTLLADHWPTGDEKSVASDYAVSFGGNAVTAAFACAKLGSAPDLICSMAPDWLGHMYADMAAAHGVALHTRQVRRSSLSCIMPNHGKRAIVRARDADYLNDFPRLDISGYRALHLDGHQPDAALHYARAFRQAGILTSLDGGGVRENTDELLRYIDVAVCAERMCEQMGLSPQGLLEFLQARGCRVGAVTLGERGMLWYGEDGKIRELASLGVPAERIVDTSGAGDVFHGAYVWSYLNRPELPWSEHFTFARAASAHKIQHLGNEAGLPGVEDVERAMMEFK